MWWALVCAQRKTQASSITAWSSLAHTAMGWLKYEFFPFCITLGDAQRRNTSARLLQQPLTSSFRYRYTAGTLKRRFVSGWFAWVETCKGIPHVWEKNYFPDSNAGQEVQRRRDALSHLSSKDSFTEIQGAKSINEKDFNDDLAFNADPYRPWEPY